MLVLASQRKSTSLVNHTCFSTFVESTSLIHNNIHNPQTVIHKFINIHESTLFVIILPGGNTEVLIIIRRRRHLL